MFDFHTKVLNRATAIGKGCFWRHMTVTEAEFVLEAFSMKQDTQNNEN